jgi:Flp pilus assembly protein TadB
MSILRSYVAAVCLASIIFALFEAPRFLRARQQHDDAVSSEESARRWLQNAQIAAGRRAMSRDTSGSDDTFKAQDALIDATGRTARRAAAYRIRLTYAVIIACVFGGHVLLLIAAEYWMRRRRPVTTQA